MADAGQRSRGGDGGGRVLAIAHRTTMGHAPENSLSGLRRAGELGADGVEFDVQLSADGVPVLMHDASVKRTAGVEGLVGELTAGELDQIEIGEGDYVPRLSEALEVMSGAGLERMLLVIELKLSAGADAEALAGAVLAEAGRAEALERAWLWSFDAGVCGALAERAPEGARIARLCLNPTEEIWRETGEQGLAGISVMHGFLRAETVAACRAHGLGCFAWTANGRGEIERAAGLGPTGIVGDYPERIRAVLDAGGESGG